jgi:hypothetical protein
VALCRGDFDFPQHNPRLQGWQVFFYSQQLTTIMSTSGLLCLIAEVILDHGSLNAVQSFLWNFLAALPKKQACF